MIGAATAAVSILGGASLAGASAAFALGVYLPFSRFLMLLIPLLTGYATGRLAGRFPRALGCSLAELVFHLPLALWALTGLALPAEATASTLAQITAVRDVLFFALFYLLPIHGVGLVLGQARPFERRTGSEG
ncbi:hypothetical protein [Limnochorda pilosa]|uniref:Uncharacterized protein n=1 Tax=Limnochorda pilosa TaxID=1555112 RepID=A0A0K2SIA4_LIMPI|nr:hypothetical protein [Limnochorda pilosa]BAS26574.1 hypothetical protein LIP_0717 [Limnochorda pilosa]